MKSNTDNLYTEGIQQMIDNENFQFISDEESKTNCCLVNITKSIEENYKKYIEICSKYSKDFANEIITPIQTLLNDQAKECDELEAEESSISDKKNSSRIEVKNLECKYFQAFKNFDEHMLTYNDNEIPPENSKIVNDLLTKCKISEKNYKFSYNKMKINDAELSTHDVFLVYL